MESPSDYSVHSAIPTGPGTWMSFVVDRDENTIGIIEWHTCSRGELARCGVYFDNDAYRRFRPDGSRWTVEQEEPLTLSPSILCRTCGHHGYIRNGQWVSV